MTSSSDNTAQQEDIIIDVQEVRKYLLEHPDFFQKNSEVLSELILKHDTGAATSLLERQIQALRKKNDDLEKNMLSRLRLAHDNEELQKKSQRIALRLLEVDNDEHILDVISGMLTDEFSSLEIYMFFNLWPESINMPDENKISDEDMSMPVCRSLLVDNDSECVFIAQPSEQFFAKQLGIQSAVAVPLKHMQAGTPSNDKQDNFGMLMLGSTDKERFNKSMGTMFLDYLADLLSSKLSRSFKKNS